MNTLKKSGYIIALLLAGMSLMTSCSKEPEATTGKKKEKTTVATKTGDSTLKERSSLNATRNGQYVNLNWHVDIAAGKIKQIQVMRNATGIKQKGKVAELGPSVTSCKDLLPDENAYWYWIKLIMMDDTSEEIGPVRVAPDQNGSNNYIKPEDIFKVSITRNDDAATLKWDFPEDQYKTISIIRFPRFVTKFKGSVKGVSVLATLERKSQCTDALPDPNSDYWYLFQITMKSGAIIYKGPIKAEYVSQ